MLPGFHTAAESGLRKGTATGNELFLADVRTDVDRRPHDLDQPLAARRTKQLRSGSRICPRAAARARPPPPGSERFNLITRQPWTWRPSRE